MGSIIKEKIEEPMYDPQLLSRLEFDKDGPFLVRPLQISDYNKGFLQLLELIRPVEDVTKEQYLRRFAEMKACPNTYYVTVIEDIRTHEIIATATLLKEQKFFYKCAVRGRLQDVAVSDKYRGQQLGKMIVNIISLLAKSLDCYKIALDCKDGVVSFYEKLGYQRESSYANYLQNFFDH